jgi:hypothetical protein
MYIWNESKASGLLLVAMTYHSIVILGQPCCLLQFWLRSPSIMALINERTPIPYSSPTILIKSQKIYNKGRLLHGHDHKFVRVRRTGAIPHVKVGRRVVPTQFVQMLHVSQEHAIPIQSLHHQAISNAPIYAGRRWSREISGKYAYSITIGTNRSNCGARDRPPRATTVFLPPKIVKSINHFQDGLLFHLPIHPHDGSKVWNRRLGQ